MQKTKRNLTLNLTSAPTLNHTRATSRPGAVWREWRRLFASSNWAGGLCVAIRQRQQQRQASSATRSHSLAYNSAADSASLRSAFPVSNASKLKLRASMPPRHAPRRAWGPGWSGSTAALWLVAAMSVVQGGGVDLAYGLRTTSGSLP